MAKKNWLGSEVGMVLKTTTVTTNTFTSSEAVTENGRTIVKSGTLITDAKLGKGLLFNDVDVTDGGRVASIMIRGSYINENLPKSLETTVVEELAKQGLYNTTYGDTTIAYGKVGGNE